MATVTATQYVEDARRRTAGVARVVAAAAARRLLNRNAVPSGLAPAPDHTGLQSIPGDKGIPILGHTVTAAALGNEFLEHRLETYGEVSWSSGLGMPIVLAFGPEATQEVFANKEKAFSQKGAEFFLGRFFKGGLMFLDAEEHHFHRRIMQEAFTRERLSGYLNSMDLIGRDAAAALASDELLIYPFLKRTLLDIATAVFMGDEPGPQSQMMAKAFTDCLRASTAVVRFPVPGSRWSAGVRGRRVLEQYFHSRLHAKRESSGDDLFATLCRIRDEDGNQFTDEDVVNHLIFLMMASTDTCSTTATAVLHQLALHPEWQHRVRAESVNEIGRGPLDLDALSRMHSLGMVINESLRLLAPVPGAIRKTLADTAIRGYFVPKDTMVVSVMWLNHYWPSMWTNPHAFDPERFSETRREDRSHRLAFVPFGAGAHKCIGTHFAAMLVKVLVHYLLFDHRIELRPGYTLEWSKNAAPAPLDGLPMRIRRVDGSDFKHMSVSQ
ncbi:cytochrome P450 [Mycobacterium sp. JS623]|nr:cytochrome P450 [Mycobacterium sp. JS623]